MWCRQRSSLPKVGLGGTPRFWIAAGHRCGPSNESTMADDDVMATMEAAAPAKATQREWIGLAVLALAALAYVMDLTVLHLAVPKLSADLQPSSSQLLWIIDIYGFFVAGALITMGTLGDRIDAAGSCYSVRQPSLSRLYLPRSRRLRRCSSSAARRSAFPARPSRHRRWR